MDSAPTHTDAPYARSLFATFVRGYFFLLFAFCACPPRGRPLYAFVFATRPLKPLVDGVGCDACSFPFGVLCRGCG